MKNCCLFLVLLVSRVFFFTSQRVCKSCKVTVDLLKFNKVHLQKVNEDCRLSTLKLTLFFHNLMLAEATCNSEAKKITLV